MKFWTSATTSFLFSIAIAGGASAQAVNATSAEVSLEYSIIEGQFNCGAAKQISEPGRFFRGPSDSKIRKEGLAAARKALSAGYNYALMAPYQLSSQAYVYSTENVYGGRKRMRERKEYHLAQACTAVDDLTAFDILWNDKAEYSAGPTAALVNLHAFVSVMEGGAVVTDMNTAPIISEDRYKRPGDKELIAKQYPVKRKAAACYSDLRPASGTNFQYTPTESENAPRDTCMSGLRTEAKAAGWADFPKFVDDRASSTATTGYQLNRPAPSSSVAPSGSLGRPADASVWGEGWTENSARYPGLDGVVLSQRVSASANSDVRFILASNTMTDTQLIDYAVYHMVKANYRGERPGITLEDKTTTERESFDHYSADARERASEDVDSGLSKLNQELERIDVRLAKYPAKRTEIDQQETEVTALVKSFPGQTEDPGAAFDAMRESLARQEREWQTKRTEKVAEIVVYQQRNQRPPRCQRRVSVTLAERPTAQCFARLKTIRRY